MQKLACAALVLLIVFSGLFCVVPLVCGETQKSGLLTSDATWTVADSPITLTGPVGVAAGVTLTIEPGVTVDFGKFYMQINGTLNARGTSDAKIVFTSSQRWITSSQMIMFMPSSTGWNEQTSSGCIIENAVFNTTILSIQDCSPEIKGSTFSLAKNTPVVVNGGAPIIKNNVFNCESMLTVSVYSSACVFEGNHLSSDGGYINGLSADSSASIINNVFANFWEGIKVSGQVTVSGNTIQNCHSGVISSSDDVNICGNYISDGNTGVTGKGTITSNTIINNKIGIQDPTAPVTNNNIYGNTQNNLVLTTSQDIDASNNYWGTTDTEAIGQTIYDSKNDFNAGTVTYVPFLMEPSTTAPTDPNAPSNTSPTDGPTDQLPTASTAPLHGQENQSGSPTPLGDQSSNVATPLPFDLIEVIVVVVVVLAIVTLVFSLYRVNRRGKPSAQ
jgi:hypothetical protein